MTTLLEDPTLIITFGVIAEIVLAVILVVTGRGVLLAIMGGVLGVVLAGVGIEYWVVTQREEIEGTIEDIAQAVAVNDKQGVLAHIDPSVADLRSLVDYGFNRADFTDARVTDLQIDPIVDQPPPPTATAHVKGFVWFKDRRGESPYDKYLADLDVKLRREPDGWIIVECKVKNDPR